MFDLTFFYEDAELTILKELPSEYKIGDAISEVSQEIKTVEEASELLYEAKMWQWFQLYNLWTLNGEVGEMFDQPTLQESINTLYSHFRDSFKASRALAVSNIKVTVDNMEFDGDEMSRFRMTTAVASLADDIETVQWALADNTIASVNRVQLGQALRLSGIEMENIWFQ